jgi:hypothetical protein
MKVPRTALASRAIRRVAEGREPMAMTAPRTRSVPKRGTRRRVTRERVK